MRRRIGWCGALAPLIAGLALAPEASAGPPPRGVKVIQHATDIDDPTKWPASSVGKVTVVWGAGLLINCTGALVGPKLVLTAAHCLHLEDRIAKPRLVHFVVGMNKGVVATHSLAASLTLAPDHSTDEPHSSAYARTDWALIELKDPIGAQPIAVAAPSAEDYAKIAADKSAFQIGFGQERPYLPSIAKGCEITAKNSGGIFGHKCLLNFGYSGSPILAQIGGTPTIIGVASLNIGEKRVRTFGAACSASEVAAEVAKRLAGPAAPKPAPPNAEP